MDAVPFTPITSEWGDNIIENIEALQDWSAYDAGTFPASLIDANAIGHGYVELKQTTLGVAGDTISITSIPNYKYIKVEFVAIATGGTLDTIWRMNNDSGNNYSFSVLNNNSGTPAFSDATSQNSIAGEPSTVPNGSLIKGTMEIINIATQRKLVTIVGTYNNGSTATRPSPFYSAGVWNNASDAINRIDYLNTGTGDFAISSEVLVSGHN